MKTIPMTYRLRLLLSTHHLLFATGVALVIALLASGIASADNPETPQEQQALPRYRHGPCPIEFYRPSGGFVECGKVTVLEDRSNPDGPTIKLAVATIRGHRTSNSNDLPNDPVIYLQGGPGAGSVEFIQRWLDDAEFLWRERDLILIDQRGMGFSQPHLECPDTSDRFSTIREELLDPYEKLASQIEAALGCRDGFVEDGIDVNAYTTANAATDVAEVAAAMGYEQWNLYGRHTVRS